ncbi:MAG: hypothetical protein AAF571_07475 [Verrucomicrobiota bacterium]
MENDSDIQWKSAHAQLERMRGMQYHYHRKFFHWLIGSLVGFFLLWIFAGRIGALWVPFLIVTAGVQASFYLHFCDFARMHARHLERKINEKAGRQVMLAGQLEDVYFYPIDSPKFSGLLPGSSFHFFSFFTLHWCLIWLAGIVFSFVYGWPALPAGAGQLTYAAGWVLWVMLNAGYLAWYFIRRRDLISMDQLLEKNLFTTAQS